MGPMWMTPSKKVRGEGELAAVSSTSFQRRVARRDSSTVSESRPLSRGSPVTRSRWGTRASIWYWTSRTMASFR